jgi:hypothetical protein
MLYKTRQEEVNAVSKEIITQTIPASEARQKLGQLMKQVFNRQSRVIVAAAFRSWLWCL